MRHFKCILNLYAAAHRNYFAFCCPWGTLEGMYDTARSMIGRTADSLALPVGIVLRRTPGVTRWAKHVWKAVAILPGAGPADWKELRREGDAVEFHAATVDLELHSTDTEGYLHGISAKEPAIYVVMREGEGAAPLEITLATASPYEAQDYADTGEELVEKVPMPEGLIAFIRDYIEKHHEDEVFIKRRRDKKRIDLKEDGKGDARIRQMADVYRSPASKKEHLH